MQTDEEKKEYITKTWNRSSGDKITEMLKRYWNLKEPVLKTKTDKQIRNEVAAAEEIFKDL